MEKVILVRLVKIIKPLVGKRFWLWIKRIIFDVRSFCFLAVRRLAYRIILFGPPYSRTKIFEEKNKQLFINHLCNFCGELFNRTDGWHCESITCPICESVARERFIINIILSRFQHGSYSHSLTGARNMKHLKVLEFSPRYNSYKKSIFKSVFKEYWSSDFALSTHKGNIKIDLTNKADIVSLEGKFDLVICSHVLEHIEDYMEALKNLRSIISDKGIVLLQFPVLEDKYTKVTWKECHNDDTKVFHRFGLDIYRELKSIFSSVELVLIDKNKAATSQEVHKKKYRILQMEDTDLLVYEIGERTNALFGFGPHDMCETFVLKR